MDNRDNNSSDLLSEAKKEKERIEKELTVTSMDQYIQVISSTLHIGYDVLVCTLLDTSTLFNVLVLIPVFILIIFDILYNLYIVLDPIPYIMDTKRMNYVKEELERYRKGNGTEDE